MKEVEYIDGVPYVSITLEDYLLDRTYNVEVDADDIELAKKYRGELTPSTYRRVLHQGIKIQSAKEHKYSDNGN